MWARGAVEDDRSSEGGFVEVDGPGSVADVEERGEGWVCASGSDNDIKRGQRLYMYRFRSVCIIYSPA